MAALPSGPLPDIVSIDRYSAALPGARTSAATRKVLLNRYRWEFVRPALQDYDTPLFHAAASRPLVAFGFPFSFIQPRMEGFPPHLLQADLGPQSQRLFRLWAVCRFTGRWPLQVIGCDDAPVHLAECAACGQVRVDVWHAFSVCPGTAVDFDGAISATLAACRAGRLSAAAELFGVTADGRRFKQRVLAVAHSLLKCMGTSPRSAEPLAAASG